MGFILNIAFSAIVISVVAFLAKTSPRVAGFVGSLPLSTLILLTLLQLEHGSQAEVTKVAKSLFVGIPSCLLFLMPFIFAERLKISFWTSYSAGLALLVVAYFLHRYIVVRWI